MKMHVITIQTRHQSHIYEPHTPKSQSLPSSIYNTQHHYYVPSSSSADSVDKTNSKLTLVACLTPVERALKIKFDELMGRADRREA